MCVREGGRRGKYVRTCDCGRSTRLRALSLAFFLIEIEDLPHRRQEERLRTTHIPHHALRQSSLQIALTQTSSISGVHKVVTSLAPARRS